MRPSRLAVGSAFLVVLLLVSGCIDSASGRAGARRTTATLTLSRTRPIVGESFRASGRLSSHFARTVVLRVRTGAHWKQVARARTTAAGRYHFSGVSFSHTRTLSVRAPVAHHAGRTYARATSKTRQVRPVTQTAALDVLPSISQQGRAPASSHAAKATVVAQFTPTRRHRTVTFGRRRADGTWTRVATTTETADGTAYLFISKRKAAMFRARAARRSGAAAIRASRVQKHWTREFDDEFTGTTLDASKWAYRSGTAASRTHATNSPDAVSVGGGTLQLHAMADPAAPATKLLNAQITTDGKVAPFTYGVFSSRIKFPKGRGQHGSFWMQSPTYGDDPGDSSASGSEIDVVEFFGKKYPGGGLGDFLYYRDASNVDQKYGSVWPRASTLLGHSDAWWKSYHVFTVQWSPAGYTFYVDGRVLNRSTRAISGTGEYLILSLLTSDWELPELDRASLPTRMDVDWTKVWQSS